MVGVTLFGPWEGEPVRREGNHGEDHILEHTVGIKGIV